MSMIKIEWESIKEKFGGKAKEYAKDKEKTKHLLEQAVKKAK